MHVKKNGATFILEVINAIEILTSVLNINDNRKGTFEGK